MFPLLVIIAVCGLYWGSVLSLFPVPWPDDSVFALVAHELFSWPPKYRMHSQAPWVPSYDVVNFNTMPGMPVLLGLGRFLGLDTVHLTRLLGMLALGYFFGLLSSWMRQRRTPPLWFWLVLLGALTSPVIRWGAMVTRPEVWQGFFWVLMLLEFDGYYRASSRWRLSALLAIAAYFHFEAIVWLLPVYVGLYPWAGAEERKPIVWFKRMWAVSWRTGVLLLPWFAYVVSHLDLFKEQMQTQFGRMGGRHLFVDSWHSFFHTLFITIGAPVDYPRFLNAGKIAFWSLAVLSVLGVTAQFFFHARRDPQRASVRAAALTGVATTFALWLDKSEVWFVAMIHMTIWCVIALFFSDLASFVRTSLARPVRLLRPVLGALLVTVIAVHLGVAWQQYKGATARGYSWAGYYSWASCINDEIGDRKRVWQPTAPDVLIELLKRRPDREYTRFVDFPGVEALVREHWLRTEAVIHSRTISNEEQPMKRREDATPADIYWLKEYPWIPNKDLNALNFPGKARLRICQDGPFWAAISLQEISRR